MSNEKLILEALWMLLQDNIGQGYPRVNGILKRCRRELLCPVGLDVSHEKQLREDEESSLSEVMAYLDILERVSNAVGKEYP